MTLRRMCRSFYLLLHCWYNALHLELALLASIRSSVSLSGGPGAESVWGGGGVCGAVLNDSVG